MTEISTLGVKHRLAFASPEISITLLFATVNAWYLYYLVNVVHLSAGLAGTAFVIGRVFDALLDPVIGRMADRHGRKKLIGYALIPAVATFLLIWALPAMITVNSARFLSATLCFAGFAFCYTMLSVPRLAMLPRFERRYHGRTKQVAFDTGFVFIAILFAIGGVPMLVASFDPAADLATTHPVSWIIVISLFGVAALIAYLPFLHYIPDSGSEELSTRRPLFRDIRELLLIPELLQSLALLFLAVAGMAVCQAILPFFLESYVGVTKVQQSYFMGLVVLSSLIGLPIWITFGRAFGKIGGLRIGLGIFVLGLGVAATLTPKSGFSSALLGTALLVGLGVSALTVYPWAIVPDRVERLEVSPNTSCIGLGTAFFTLANKLATSAAIMSVSIVLEIAGHRQGHAQQDPVVTRAIYLAATMLPAGFATCCALITWRHKM